MKRIAIAIVVMLTAACGKKSPPVASAPPPPASRPVVLAGKIPAAGLQLPPEKPAGSCKSTDDRPDKNCTPGVPDPNVTQANIRTTICVSGYTDTVRPPTSYTDALRDQQIREYGFTDKTGSDYEEDHFIPLEIGGSPTDPKNLWPEFGPRPNPKDKIENELKKAVCDGKMTLAAARKAIQTNWKTVQIPQ